MELDADGWLDGAIAIPSPNCDARPDGSRIDLLVIHAISLPPGEFGGQHIAALFQNRLDPDLHPYFHSIQALRVSAHFLISRDGTLTQFVSCLQRAWHAGVSCWQARERCNDFSIGIELEGTDFEPFTQQQYDTLNILLGILCARYPIRGIAGHSDIAPGRKTDPGPFFDWAKVIKPIRVAG
jgi:AmpD protein